MVADADRRVAAIVRADVLVVTRDRQTLAVATETHVAVRAGVAVVARSLILGRKLAAERRDARVRCAGQAVVANDRRTAANAFRAGIAIRALVIVRAVRRRRFLVQATARTGITAVCRADVAVVAVLQNARLALRALARVVLRALVAVLTLGTVDLLLVVAATRGIAEIVRAGVVIRADDACTGAQAFLTLIVRRALVAIVARIVGHLFVDALTDFVAAVLGALIAVIAGDGDAVALAVEALVAVRADETIFAWDVDVVVVAAGDLVAAVLRAGRAVRAILSFGTDTCAGRRTNVAECAVIAVVAGRSRRLRRVLACTRRRLAPVLLAQHVQVALLMIDTDEDVRGRKFRTHVLGNIRREIGRTRIHRDIRGNVLGRCDRSRIGTRRCARTKRHEKGWAEILHAFLLLLG